MRGKREIRDAIEFWERNLKQEEEKYDPIAVAPGRAILEAKVRISTLRWVLQELP